ncbi:MAG: AMP-binding protein [Candidatus Omnitrophota bacterium]|jgi:long-chain acyl-CoA synthetase
MAQNRLSIFEEFAQVAKTYPSKTAVFFKNNNDYSEVSYLEIYQKALKLGNFLIHWGVQKSDRIAILIGNQLEWPVSFFAVQFAGAVAVPIDVRLPAPDITQLVIHSSSKIILCAEKVYAQNTAFLDGLKSVKILLIDSVSFQEQFVNYSLKMQEAPVFRALDTVAAMFYTSGTTALPKAVMLSQVNLLANVESIRKIKIVTHQDCLISFLPLHHTYSCMVTCLVPLLLGAQISYPASLNSDDLLNCMQETKVSILVGVPQFFSIFHKAIKQKFKKIPLLLRAGINVLIWILWVFRKLTGVNLNKYLLHKMHSVFGNKLRFMTTGGAKIETTIIVDFFKWGFTILEGYGLTETSPVVTFNPPLKPKIGTVGKPIPGVQVKILNPDEQGVGKVAIRGENVMLGYYQLPQENARVLKDGWFLTEDLGYFDKSGYLCIKGRKDEIIVLSSGKKINPEEIEREYLLSPYIKEICVFVASRVGFIGEAKQLMAVIVPHEEYFTARGVLNIEEKIRWELDNLSHQISHYKRVTGIIISKEKLPRTALGKIMRHKIEEKYVQEGGGVFQNGKGGRLSEDVSSFSSEISKKILEQISKRLNRNVKLDDHLELDLGLDSLGRIELLLELFKFLNIQASESIQSEFFFAHTIRDLLLKLEPFIPQDVKYGNQDEFLWSETLHERPSSKTLNMVRFKPFFIDKIAALLVITIVRYVLRVFFLLSIKGRGNLPKNGPYIVFANHSSYLDGFVIAALLPFHVLLKTYFVGLKRIFLKPFIRDSIKLARLIPIDVTLDLVEAMRICAYLLAQKKIVSFFPEGQRNPEGGVIRFKKGIGILAKELNIPLVPVYIDGTFQAWPRHAKLPRFHAIKVTIGKPLSYAELVSQKVLKSDDYDAVAEALRQELLALKK